MYFFAFLSRRICSTVRHRQSTFYKPFSTAKTFAVDMETVNTSKRLGGLRDLMKKNGIDVYSMTLGPILIELHLLTLPVVPSEDSHQSEYIAPCDARRGWKALLESLLNS
jgi:Xaa-Pro aminopeptidase